MAKTPAPASKQAEAPTPSAHEVARSRVLAAASELGRQIREHEGIITDAEADLEQIKQEAEEQARQAQAWQEENERISAELSEARLAMGLYSGTSMAASLQERLNTLEARQGTLANLLTTWHVETIARETRQAEQVQSLSAELEADRAYLASLYEKKAELQRAFEEARLGIGQERLAALKEKITALEEQKAAALGTAKVAELALTQVRRSVAEELADFPELAEEAKHLGPPEALSRGERLKAAGLAFIQELWQIGYLSHLGDWSVTERLLQAVAFTPQEIAGILDDAVSHDERTRRFVAKRDAIEYAPTMRY